MPFEGVDGLTIAKALYGADERLPVPIPGTSEMLKEVKEAAFFPGEESVFLGLIYEPEQTLKNIAADVEIITEYTKEIFLRFVSLLGESYPAIDKGVIEADNNHISAVPDLDPEQSQLVSLARLSPTSLSAAC
ncbi:hypothetical protein COT42_01220 [Candidatus Saganbacteria bacterium CG08_land_8_20_14_0_20_45_16]|uniref:Uncharacterized protein n=1 Tax=Candidatus Saganbacteria bacterium CG08_land_8_20_14_0_20_45_16 TaxID=2014293 RepID=A0A2H0Y218_UNCSA|nr:MAG: hypothetical protein COT42_01220 [Candidatus Saganbacteria bacterium CG08_land_8_20_14_0_20_45_16]